MPAFPFVSIDADDDSVDFGRFKSAGTKSLNGLNSFNSSNNISNNIISNDTAHSAPSSKPSTRTLILAPPSIAAHEEKLRAIFAPGAYDRAACDLQMLDRLAAGFVPLAASTYDVVLVLTDADGSQRDEALGLLSSRQVFGALVPAMKNGARLQFQDGARLDGAGAREAILAGLVDKDGVFEKAEEEMVVVPLRLKKKKAAPAAAAAPKPAAAVAPAATPAKRSAVVLDLGEYSDGEELVDEDSLLTAEERSRPPQQRESPTFPLFLVLYMHRNCDFFILTLFLFFSFFLFSHKQLPRATLMARSAASPARTARAVSPSVSKKRTAIAASRPTPSSPASSSSTATTLTSSTLRCRARRARATAALWATPSAARRARTLACQHSSPAKKSRF